MNKPTTILINPFLFAKISVKVENNFKDERVFSGEI